MPLPCSGPATPLALTEEKTQSLALILADEVWLENWKLALSCVTAH